MVNIWMSHHSALSLLILNNNYPYPITLSNNDPFKSQVLIPYHNHPALIKALNEETFDTLDIYFMQQDPDLFKVYSSSLT
jgi:hypothetical protein